MNNQYIQNLRYKLQKRFRRLNSAEPETFYFVFKQFWAFLKGYPIFMDVLERLKYLYLDSEQSAKRIYQSFEVLFGEFLEQFLTPLYEYLDENLDDTGVVLALLNRYKHRSEWFHRVDLLEQYKQETKKGEKNLALNLYEYLYEQGLDFSIEAWSISGAADLVSAQNSKEPFIADTKIFNPDKNLGKTYLAKGFRQIYQYTLDYNQPFGYLIIYKICESELPVKTSPV